MVRLSDTTLPSPPLFHALPQQDFVALQHYTGSWTYDDPARPPLNASSTVVGADGVPLPQADSPWLFVFPHALRSLLGWLQRRYGAPIYITENGVSAPGKGRRCRLAAWLLLAGRRPRDAHTVLRCIAFPPLPHRAAGESGRPAAEVLCDSFRLSYYQQYVGNATEAKQRDGVDLRGYFAWCGAGCVCCVGGLVGAGGGGRASSSGIMWVLHAGRSESPALQLCPSQ